MECHTTRRSEGIEHTEGTKLRCGDGTRDPKSGLPSEGLTYYDAFMSIPANPFVERGVARKATCEARF